MSDNSLNCIGTLKLFNLLNGKDDGTLCNNYALI